jgi:Zinc knuckle
LEIFGTCFNCGQQGHYAAACPAGTYGAAPAGEQAAQQRQDRESHLAAIAAIVMQWHDGKITLAQKRGLIVGENLKHYAGPLHGSREHLTRLP